MMRLALTAFCLFLTASQATAKPDPATLLQAADAARSPGLSSYVSQITITPRRGDKTDPTSRYDVLTSVADGAIVTALTADEAGQKFLATDRGFWFFAPRTHRAIRLTPLQLLRGQASIGDISRVSFARDYALVSESAAKTQGAAVWTLELKAKSPAATYARVLLDVSEDGRPVAGRFFGLSGRLLKSVRFGERSTVSGHPMISETTYVDGVDPTATTVVRVLGIRPASAPRGAFSPEALAAQ